MSLPPTRRESRRLYLGGLPVGGGAPVTVQSMLTVHPARRLDDALAQALSLEQAGCEIIRVAVPDEDAVQALPRLASRISAPLVADVHFDHRLALGAIEAGVPGVRINPCNFGADWKVAEVVGAAKERGVLLRIGANSGSLSERELALVGGDMAAAMLNAARRQIDLLSASDFSDYKVSLKSTDLSVMLEANRRLAQEYDCPLHLGLTESGTAWRGAIRSSAALSLLLSEGLGDTIRVSLSGDPVREVEVGLELLRFLGLRSGGVRVIACPSCGRCSVDPDPVALRVERALSGLDNGLRVAVMGCEVNGPGEARHADLGIAFGRRDGLLFCRGREPRKMPNDHLEEALIRMALASGKTGDRGKP